MSFSPITSPLMVSRMSESFTSFLSSNGYTSFPITCRPVDCDLTLFVFVSSSTGS
jgi:hypothetical protein